MNTEYANQVFKELIEQQNKDILKQDKSQIITNPFIPNEQKNKELEEIDKQANEIIEKEYNKRRTRSILNMSFDEISKNISLSISGVLEDFLGWSESEESVVDIFQKEQRYAFIGILIVFLCLLYIIYKS